MKADCSIKAKTVNLIAAGFDGAILFKEPSPSDPDAADEQKLEDEGLWDSIELNWFSF